MKNSFNCIHTTGLVRNKFSNSEDSRMRYIRLNEVTFELHIIQMMRLTYIKLKITSTKFSRLLSFRKLHNQKSPEVIFGERGGHAVDK